MARSRAQEAGVGALLLVALAVLGWLSLRVGALGPVGDQVQVTLRTEDAAGLQAGALVAVAGVEVGSVASLRVEHDQAVATLSLDRAAGLRRDVVARVRARSLLGEKYVQLQPVSKDAPPLVDGDELTIVGPQVEVDEVLDALGPMLGSVDGEAVGAALEAMTDALREDPERLGRMLARADVLLDQGATTAERLPALVDRLDGTLDAVDRAVGTLQRRLDEAASPVAKADRLLDELQEAAEPLDGAVADARAALGDARGALGDTRALLGDLDGLGPDVRRLVANFAEIDKWEIRRLLREEGILVRIRRHDVVPDER